MSTAMKPNTFRRIVRVLAATAVLAGVAVAAVVDAGWAHADGVISPREWRFVNTYGASVVCPTLAQHPTEAGAQGVITAIYEAGWNIGDAADIVAAAIAEFCPDFTTLRRYAELTGQGGQLA
jgi:hypothetical protein